MKLLRDKAFQDLPVGFKRPRRVFYVAPGVTDQVTSRMIVKDAEGKPWGELRPN